MDLGQNEIKANQPVSRYYQGSYYGFFSPFNSPFDQNQLQS